MMDGIVSQQECFDLPNVLDETVETFLRDNMTFREMADVGVRTAVGKIHHKLE